MEPKDLQFLYELENNTDIWEISGTSTPYSRQILGKYLENAHRDIYEIKQLRLGICSHDDKLLGLVDLFDFDPKNHRAGIGIVILQDERNKGVGTEAIALMCRYSFDTLQLRQLYANILEDNKASIQLFDKMGFRLVGCKKDWIYSKGTYKNELLYQKITT